MKFWRGTSERQNGTGSCYSMNDQTPSIGLHPPASAKSDPMNHQLPDTPAKYAAWNPLNKPGRGIPGWVRIEGHCDRGHELKVEGEPCELCAYLDGEEPGDKNTYRFLLRGLPVSVLLDQEDDDKAADIFHRLLNEFRVDSLAEIPNYNRFKPDIERLMKDKPKFVRRFSDTEITRLYKAAKEIMIVDDMMDLKVYADELVEAWKKKEKEKKRKAKRDEHVRRLEAMMSRG